MRQGPVERPKTGIFGRFARDRAGNFGVLFALMLVPLVVTVGSALDFVNIYNTQAKLQADLDASLLSAVGKVTTLDAVTLKSSIIKTYNAQAGLYGQDKLLDTNISINTTTSVVTANISSSVNTMFLGIVGRKSVNVRVTSTAAGGETITKNSVSMYLVLDRSGSMIDETTTSYTGVCYTKKNVAYACTKYFTKIESLIMAVNDLMKQMATADPTKEYVRIGAVSYNDVTQTPSNLAWGSTAANTYVSALTATGGTDSSPGMKLSYDALMLASEDAAHVAKSGQKPVKYIILMTDGENSTTTADTNTKAICAKAKLAKIEVFTVAFMAPYRGQALLSYCATDSSHYFEATDTASIISAFTKIGKTASKNLVRLTN